MKLLQGLCIVSLLEITWIHVVHLRPLQPKPKAVMKEQLSYCRSIKSLLNDEKVLARSILVLLHKDKQEIKKCLSDGSDDSHSTETMYVVDATFPKIDNNNMTQQEKFLLNLRYLKQSIRTELKTLETVIKDVHDRNCGEELDDNLQTTKAELAARKNLVNLMIFCETYQPSQQESLGSEKNETAKNNTLKAVGLNIMRDMTYLALEISKEMKEEEAYFDYDLH